MKENFYYIENYDKATVCDIETDGLLDSITKIHIFGFQIYNSDEVKWFFGDTQEHRIRDMLEWHIDNKIPMVFHNGITFDKRALEVVLNVDLEELQIIDTLWLSYYLNIDKPRHSVEVLSKDYDAGNKFEVDSGDWENLSKEKAIKRVTSDVEIGRAIWEDFKSRLEEMYSMAKSKIDVGEIGGKRSSSDEVIYIDALVGKSVDWHVSRILGYISSIADVIALQETVGWSVDINYLQEHLSELEDMAASSREELESVMPPVPKYVKRTPPRNPYKKNGDLSVAGERWENLKHLVKNGDVNEFGHPLAEVREVGFIHELRDMEKPNANSPDQVKGFLYTKGWKPKTFNSVRDKEAFTAWVNNRPKEGSSKWEWNMWREERPVDRKVEQIKDGGDLCESVVELAKDVPEVSVLEEYSIIQHRIGVLKGIRDSIRSDGRVEAGANGLTNTLRLQHRRPIVNLPSVSRKYAAGIRGSLVAEKGYTLLGSDLSSLEDRVKIHLMEPHDPQLAHEMSLDTFDPHIAQAVAMGLITEVQGRGYVNKTLSEEETTLVAHQRELAKPVNYLSAYGGTYKALMLQTGWSEQRCKDAIEAYWELNHSLRSIADEQVVVTTSRKEDWLIHPIMGIMLSIRSDKDRFNLVCQGGGSFFHFNWIFGILNKQKEAWGRKTITANIHDEIVVCIRDRVDFKNKMGTMVKESVKEVSENYMLRRSLDCDVSFGYKYANIH